MFEFDADSIPVRCGPYVPGFGGLPADKYRRKFLDSAFSLVEKQVQKPPAEFCRQGPVEPVVGKQAILLASRICLSLSGTWLIVLHWSSPRTCQSIIILSF